MKRRILNCLLVALICTFWSNVALAQTTPPDVFVFQVYPAQPTTADSVYVSLTYTSNDGCPDYYLAIDSVEPFMVSVVARKIDNSKAICTQMFSKFVTRINLGLLGQSTNIFANYKLLQTVVPTCTPDRKGVVVAGTGACAGRLFLKEQTVTASAVQALYSLDRAQARNADGTPFTGFSIGDEVKFGAIITPSTTLAYNPCPVLGFATCCVITYHEPDCWLNRMGLVVKGVDGCTGEWFLQDLSPVYSYKRLYRVKNDGDLVAGAKTMFGAVDFPSDSVRSILCPVYGTVRCYIHFAPVLPDTLAGTAYTGDSVVKAGMAILLQKGFRRALKAMPLKEGKFEFTNLELKDYTVYVIPDRKLNPDYLPTFYISKLAYKNADYFTMQDGRNEIAVNLRKFEKRVGKGKIFGNVFFETSNLKDSILNYYGSKTDLYTTENNTAVNLPVILFNSAGTPIAWTLSDENGNYEFDNIALDTYRIVTETAETSAESSVALTQDNSVVGANMMLKVQSLIDSVPIEQTPNFSMYLNTVSSQLNIESDVQTTVRIYDSLGRLMLQQPLALGKNVVDVQHLGKGLYVVRAGLHAQKLMRP